MFPSSLDTHSRWYMLIISAEDSAVFSWSPGWFSLSSGSRRTRECYKYVKLHRSAHVESRSPQPKKAALKPFICCGQPFGEHLLCVRLLGWRGPKNSLCPCVQGYLPSVWCPPRVYVLPDSVYTPSVFFKSWTPANRMLYISVKACCPARIFAVLSTHFMILVRLLHGLPRSKGRGS